MKLFPFLAVSFLSWTFSGMVGAQTPGVPPAPAHPETTTLQANNLFMDGLRARLKGEPKEALQLFQRYTELRPQDAAGWYELARVNLREGKADQAERHTRKAVALAPDNKWYQMLLSDVLTLQMKYDQAAEVLEKLALKNPYDDENRLKASLLYQRTKNFKKAAEQLDYLLKNNPGDEEILMQKQQLYLKMNETDKALEISRNLIEANPSEPRYQVQLGQIYENNGKSAEALKVYEEALRKFPGDPVIQLSLADYYRKNNNPEKYQEFVRKAITNKGFDAETQVALLLPYIQEMAQDSARRQEGVEIAEQLSLQHPGDAQVQLFYGELLQMTGNSEKASEQFRKVVALDPSKFPAWQQLLFSYTAPKDADSLVVASERALRLFPTQAMVHYLNGVGHQNKKDYKRSASALQRAIDLQPEDNPQLLSQMYVSLGDTYNFMKNYPESDSAYEAALRLDPENATVYNNYAYYLSVRNARLKDAERMSKKSLELRPDEGTFLDTYGWILYQEGRYKEALDYIQRAIKNSGENADGTLYDHLGDVHYKLNEKSKALEAWKKAREKGTDNPNLDRKIAEGKLYE